MNRGLFYWKTAGGPTSESRHILRIFSTMAGMILTSKGQDSYRQGLLLHSMSQGWKAWSIMKSKP